jgi:hypothetical protein
LPLIHYNLGQNMSTVSLSSFFFLSSNTNWLYIHYKRL